MALDWSKLIDPNHPLWDAFIGDAGLLPLALGLLNVVLALIVFRSQRLIADEQKIISSFQAMIAREHKQDTAYGDLDTAYQQLLSQRAQRPWLAKPDLAQFDHQVDKQLAEEACRIHGYQVWTLLEAIRDRLKDDTANQGVWQPIIRSEGRRFLDQLVYWWREERAFQDDFVKFILGGGFRGIYPAGSPDDEETREFEALAQAALGKYFPASRVKA